MPRYKSRIRKSCVLPTTEDEEVCAFHIVKINKVMYTDIKAFNFVQSYCNPRSLHSFRSATNFQVIIPEKLYIIRKLSYDLSLEECTKRASVTYSVDELEQMNEKLVILILENRTSFRL